jgi:hypothetical protein
MAQEEAIQEASEHPLSVDAVIAFDSMNTDTPHYTIRGNHTDLPSTRLLYNEFDLLSDPHYKLYWLFANLQQTIDRSDELPFTRAPQLNLCKHWLSLEEPS